MLKLPFNPVERAGEVERVVMHDGKSKYYRFRYTRYYGGIVTAELDPEENPFEIRVIENIKRSYPRRFIKLKEIIP